MTDIYTVDWHTNMWFVCDVPGTEYARSMAKLAKTLQQTINEDVRLAVFFRLFAFTRITNCYRMKMVKKHTNCVL